MYWTNLDGVVAELTRSEFADEVASKYLLAFVAWMAIEVAILGWAAIDATAHPLFLVLQILGFIAPVIGTYVVLFRTLPRASGFRLLPAYMAVGWVVNVRTTLILSPLILLSIYCNRLSTQFPVIGQLLSVVVPLVFYFVFYSRLARALRQTYVTASS